MIIARRKRKENIAEYLLYMWQVEDLIRANNFDMDSIRRTVVDRYDQPDDIKEEIAKWYEELIEMMRSEGVMEKGHIQLNKNVIIALTHQPQVSGLVDGWNRSTRPAPEGDRKFPAAKVRRVKALAALHPAGDDVLKLAGVVRGSGLIRHLKVRLDDIVHVLQQQRGTLHNLLRSDKVERLAAALRRLTHVAA